MATYESNEIKNYMEDSVLAAMKQILPGLKMCLCERCWCDIAALALNELPPKYIVTRKGQLYTKLNIFEQQFSVDITTAIIKSAEFVAQRPRHDNG